VNAEPIGLAIALALLGSAGAFAGHPASCSPVYATPGSSQASKSSVAAGPTRHGRSCVYVGEVKAPVAKATVADTMAFTPGRA
jgi:hypothetical protein